MIANASSRSAATCSAVGASTFSRSSGSVLLGRTLTHQSVAGDGQPVEPVRHGPVGEGRGQPRP